MSGLTLSLENVGKCYAVYASNIERFANWFGADIRPKQEFWAVDDITLQVAGGESLALIGQNGAGKSTLLKLITGTVRPTRGTIGVEGRISAILELGLGFNPEFTGRENVLQAGGLLGIPQSELHQLMPEIEAFAELGEFFDQPFRVYSSGMQARLAFALATAKRPDILIVDEVLSVGDSYFQHKSFNRIRAFKNAGTSIILVSHAMGDVRALCDRVLLLEKGRVTKDGPPDEVVDHYNALMALKENQKLDIEQRRDESGWVRTRSGSFEVTAETVELVDAASGTQVATARVGQDLVLRVAARARDGIGQLVFGYMLRDRTGHIVFGTNTWHTKQVAHDVRPEETVTFETRFKCNLGPGSYSITLSLSSSETHLEQNYEWTDNSTVFDVVNVDEDFFIGTNWLGPESHVSRTS